MLYIFLWRWTQKLLLLGHEDTLNFLLLEINLHVVALLGTWKMIPVGWRLVTENAKETPSWRYPETHPKTIIIHMGIGNTPTPHNICWEANHSSDRRFKSLWPSKRGVIRLRPAWGRFFGYKNILGFWYYGIDCIEGSHDFVYSLGAQSKAGWWAPLTVVRERGNPYLTPGHPLYTEPWGWVSSPWPALRSPAVPKGGRGAAGRRTWGGRAQLGLVVRCQIWTWRCRRGDVCVRAPHPSISMHTEQKNHADEHQKVLTMRKECAEVCKKKLEDKNSEMHTLSLVFLTLSTETYS